MSAENAVKRPFAEGEREEKKLPPSATLQACATFGYLQKAALDKKLSCPLYLCTLPEITPSLSRKCTLHIKSIKISADVCVWLYVFINLVVTAEVFWHQLDKICLS